MCNPTLLAGIADSDVRVHSAGVGYTSGSFVMRMALQRPRNVVAIAQTETNTVSEKERSECAITSQLQRPLLTAAWALAIVSSIIGMGVNPTWAGSDTPAGTLFSYIHSQADLQPSSTIRHRSRHAQACRVVDQECDYPHAAVDFAKIRSRLPDWPAPAYAGYPVNNATMILIAVVLADVTTTVCHRY